LIGSGLFSASNYFWVINFSYTDVLWIFPLALIMIHSNSWAFFFKTAALPFAVFLFLGAFGFNWLPVKGIGVAFGEFVMLLSLPFMILDLTVRDRMDEGADLKSGAGHSAVLLSSSGA